ncbi:hypothetical protein J6590_105764, partial [Homalodisca vitripennis]
TESTGREKKLSGPQGSYKQAFEILLTARERESERELIETVSFTQEHFFKELPLVQAVYSGERLKATEKATKSTICQQLTDKL